MTTRPSRQLVNAIRALFGDVGRGLQFFYGCEDEGGDAPPDSPAERARLQRTTLEGYVISMAKELEELGETEQPRLEAEARATLIALRELEKREDTFCIEGHEPVTCREVLPADRVQMLLRPAEKDLRQRDRSRASRLIAIAWSCSTERKEYAWEEAVALAAMFKESSEQRARELRNERSLCCDSSEGRR